MQSGNFRLAPNLQIVIRPTDCIKHIMEFAVCHTTADCVKCITQSVDHMSLCNTILAVVLAGYQRKTSTIVFSSSSNHFGQSSAVIMVNFHVHLHTLMHNESTDDLKNLNTIYRSCNVLYANCRSCDNLQTGCQ